MTPRLSPIEQARRRRRRLGISILAASVLILGPLLFMYARARLREVPLDETTMCPTDRPPSAQIVLLLDVTDSYSPVQTAAAMKSFREIQAAVPQHGRVSVFTLESDSNDQIQPVVALCNPGTGGSRWDSAPETQMKKWREEFQKPLEDLMSQLLLKEPATRSPILAKIQALSVSGFENIPGERRLYVLSDLLQHDERYSHYSNSHPPEFDKFVSAGLLDVYRAELEDVSVFIIYVRRDGMKDVQGKRHVQFWERYFDSTGAIVQEVSKLTG